MQECAGTEVIIGEYVDAVEGARSGIKGAHAAETKVMIIAIGARCHDDEPVWCYGSSIE